MIRDRIAEIKCLCEFCVGKPAHELIFIVCVNGCGRYRSRIILYDSLGSDLFSMPIHDKGH